MSILSVEEMRDSPEMGYGLDGDRKYTRTFLVISDDKDDGPVTVVTDPNIPQHYDTYAYGNESDRGSVVIDIDPQRDEKNPTKWVVTVTYGSKEKAATRQRNANKKPRDVDDDDTPDRMDIRYYTEAREQAAVRDVETNEAIVNAAGDLFDPPPVIPDPVLVIDITRDESEEWFGSNQITEFIKRVNSKPFFGRAVGTCLMDDIQADRQYENNRFFWRVNYKIKWTSSTDKWKAVLLEYGPNFMDAASTDPQRFVDVSGNPIMKKLTSTGGPLADASTDEFARFTIYKEANFDNLLLNDMHAGI